MITTYYLNCIMGNVFQTDTSPSMPTSFYIGLSKTTPNVSGGNVTEPSGGGYARVKVTSLGVPDNGSIINTADVNFPESTSDWGTITHYVLYDAASGGNLLLYQPLQASKNIQSDTQARFKAGALTFTLSNPTT